MARDIEWPEEEVSPSPAELRLSLPALGDSLYTVTRTREDVTSILSGRDDRLLVAVGPCSIDSYTAAVDYGTRLRMLADELSSSLCIVMRVYVEKPRSTAGWKGFANDPSIDGSCDIARGLCLSRQLFKDLTATGLPIATEVLNPFTIKYLEDFVSLGMIGARTTESQVHREISSNLPFPIGFKNGTDGNLSVAIQAMGAARVKHSFLGACSNGRVAVTHSMGNPNCFPVLRGGHLETNFDPESVAEAQSTLTEAGERSVLMIDCSHGNCKKKAHLIPYSVESVSQQIERGNRAIVGVMFESYLEEGNQPNEQVGESCLQYGLSLTDPCVGWEDTVRLLHLLASAVVSRRKRLEGSLSEDL